VKSAYKAREAGKGALRILARFGSCGSEVVSNRLQQGTVCIMVLANIGKPPTDPLFALVW
jgi:hypothetical protein